MMRLTPRPSLTDFLSRLERVSTPLNVFGYEIAISVAGIVEGIFLFWFFRMHLPWLIPLIFLGFVSSHLILWGALLDFRDFYNRPLQGFLVATALLQSTLVTIAHGLCIFTIPTYLIWLRCIIELALIFGEVTIDGFRNVRQIRYLVVVGCLLSMFLFSYTAKSHIHFGIPDLAAKPGETMELIWQQALRFWRGI